MKRWSDLLTLCLATAAMGWASFIWLRLFTRIDETWAHPIMGRAFCVLVVGLMVFVVADIWYRSFFRKNK